MKYPDNIKEMATLQPDYIGFIFYEQSARLFNNTMPPINEHIKKVGVFVDADLNQVIEKVITYNLKALQLHGNESPEFCTNLKKHLINNNKPDVEIIKVFSLKDEFNFEVLKPYENVCDYYLFDTKGKLPGGNGYTFDWNILNEYPSSKLFFLSGGIGLDEVEAIKQFKKSEASKYCFALDVNSKFEIKPGLKNIQKLTTFKNKLSHIL